MGYFYSMWSTLIIYGSNRLAIFESKVLLGEVAKNSANHSDNHFRNSRIKLKCFNKEFNAKVVY